MHRCQGFTLVELVLVIVLCAVVGAMVSTVLSRPLEGFVAQSRRAELTDLAAIALNRMAREIRLAVPNSIRTPGCSSGGDCRTLEWLAIHEAGRYRANLEPGGMRHDPLRCAAASCRIPLLSPGMEAGRVSEANWMVVYNVGAAAAGIPQAGANVWAYANPGVISPDGLDFALETSADDKTIVLSGAAASGFAFAFASPQRRFYLVRERVRYRCEGARLLRSTAENLDDSNGDQVPMADSVAECSFTYAPGTNSRNGIVTLRLSLAQAGETVTLIQQVHIDNAP